MWKLVSIGCSFIMCGVEVCLQQTHILLKEWVYLLWCVCKFDWQFKKRKRATCVFIDSTPDKSMTIFMQTYYRIKRGTMSLFTENNIPCWYELIWNWCQILLKNKNRKALLWCARFSNDPYEQWLTVATYRTSTSSISTFTEIGMHVAEFSSNVYVTVSISTFYCFTTL